MMTAAAGVIVSFVVMVNILLSHPSSAHFTSDGLVPVSMNKVWPYHNPFETYSYYEVLPVCQPDKLEFERMSFGQIMRGDRMANSIYTIHYRVPVEASIVCTKTLTPDEVSFLRRAIDQTYMFEIFVDDLPVTQRVGTKFPQADGLMRYFLVTQLDFNLGYNDGYVVTANITTDQNLVELPSTSNTSVQATFKYSVTWTPSTTPVHARLQQQLAGALTTPSQGLDVHWLAITNSFVLVLFITSILLLIVLRVVRGDLAKYLHIPDEELSSGEDDSGWKLLHADVFRSPSHRMWFCACIGSGAHIFLVALVTVSIGCFSPYIERGAILSAAVFGYFFTSFVAGFISANLYRRLGGVQWGWNIIVTIFMFMGPVFAMWSILNSVAMAYQSTVALPFSAAAILFLSWLFVTTPLTVLGAVIGRYRANKTLETTTAFPCKTNRLAREIPMTHWRHSPWLQVILAGFLPFSAIYIELHYVFLSVWGSKIYTLYGVLFFAFVMLLLVAGTVSVLLTYFHLNGEDYRWWWRALVSGGSISVFFLIHCVYYFLTSTRMFGFLQCSFFFGYSIVVAWGLFLMVGFVTFACNYFFVSYIYSSIKSD